MEIAVIFEDDCLMVLDKPAGWIVNDSTTVGTNSVLEKWLSNLDFPLSKNKEFRHGIVHRLDKETSGIILIAKTEDVFHFLQRQFKERKVKKVYIALLHGKLEPSEGFVNVPVGRLPWNRERFGVLPGARASYTDYKVVDYYLKGKDKYSLVNFYPETGRTHQIRIHAKYMQHSIVGDNFYAGRKISRHDRTWCPRLFLHAEKISFTHPKSLKEVSFESPLPPDLKSALKTLEKAEI